MKIFLSFCLFLTLALGVNADAKKSLTYTSDKFTGEEILSRNIEFGPTDAAFFYRGGNYFEFRLEHKKGSPVSKILRANLHGAGSSGKRADDSGNYIGKPELLFIVDGLRKNISILKTTYINDFKQQVYLPANSFRMTAESYERHSHVIDFTLDISDEDLAQMASAKNVQMLFREHLIGQDMDHEYQLGPAFTKELRLFTEALKNYQLSEEK